MTTRAVSVVVPTVGRRPLLQACVESLLRCSPAAQEIVVVDQSGDREVEALIESFGPPVRRIADDGRGIARAINAGLRAAVCDVVLQTNDDCTVAEDWVGAAWSLMQERPDGIVTGRVLPSGDPAGTPSIKTDETPHDFSGEPPQWVLYGTNLAMPRQAVLDLGGYDERAGLLVAAEDNDLSYRWMDAGRPVRYEPTMVVWHHDWRDARQLQRRYRVYARGQGAFYAKHLLAGDRRIVRAVLDDVRRGARAVARSTIRRTWHEPDEARALLLGVPLGLLRAWPEARRLRHRG